MNATDITPPAESAVPVSARTATQFMARPLKSRSFLRRAGLWLIAALLVAGAGFFVYRWKFAAAKVRYDTAAVQRGDVESTVVAAGVLQPIKYVDVGAQTSGKLKSLKVKRGDQVKENQLLAEIDPVLAESSLTSANATLENVTSQHAVKKAQLVLATAQKARNDDLFKQSLISASDRDITQANYDVAVADLAALAAQMKQAAAAVETAKANVGYTKITAPMAGQVVSIAALEGQTLNANQQAPNILRIADVATMTVWAQVSEADIDDVQEGQDVYFTVLGQDKRWNSKIGQILPTPELINNVVFYDVLFDVPNPKGELNIMMTAQVFIVQAAAKSVLLIPTAAVGNANQGAEINVQVLNADGAVEPRAIKIGIKSEIMTEVASGLQENEKVVIREIAAKATSTRSPLAARRGP